MGNCVSKPNTNFVRFPTTASHFKTNRICFLIHSNSISFPSENCRLVLMRRFLRKLRQLLVNALLLFTMVCAVATIYLPNTNLFSRIFWVGSALVIVFSFLLFPKRRLSKNRYQDNQGYMVVKGSGEYETDILQNWF